MKNAVLVGIQTPQISLEELDESLLELSRLVKTLGYNVIGTLKQKRSSQKLAIVLGEGKLKELALWTGGTGVIKKSFVRKKNKAELSRDAIAETEEENIEDNEELEEAEDQTSDISKEKAHVVIVDCDLSPTQLRNLENAVGVTVFDRTGVIIEIFSRHARTRESRLQVEIARLNYLSPRLRETGESSERIGGKGAGETALELDKRRIRDRVKELKTELETIGIENQIRRAKRERELVVALVGYTNAGKSSLMRALTGSEVLIADKLFATLDTTIRPLHPESQPKVLISDTVGFIKKLPHDLVASFKSTLDEAANATLLLYVVDASDPSLRAQLEVTQNVLKEVGASEVPSLIVLNKKDRLSENEFNLLKVEFPDAIFISTREKKDIKILRDQIMTHFEHDMTEEDLFVPFTAKRVVGEIRTRMRVLSENYNAVGVTFRVRTSAENLTYIKKMLQT